MPPNSAQRNTGLLHVYGDHFGFILLLNTNVS